MDEWHIQNPFCRGWLFQAPLPHRATEQRPSRMPFGISRTVAWMLMPTGALHQALSGPTMGGGWVWAPSTNAGVGGFGRQGDGYDSGTRVENQVCTCF